MRVADYVGLVVVKLVLRLQTLHRLILLELVHVDHHLVQNVGAVIKIRINLILVGHVGWHACVRCLIVVLLLLCLLADGVRLVLDDAAVIIISFEHLGVRVHVDV